MATHTRKNRGVCSRTTTVTIQNGTLVDVQVEDGCDGNLQAVCTLLKGRSAKEAIELLQGITCEEKSTSCPAQIALCIEETLAEETSTLAN